MSIYIKLYFIFLKIGLVSFGGGLSMLPLIEEEILSRGWMTSVEFMNLVSIAQMTPGPIAINSATYVGNNTAGILGGVVATIGVMTPSIIIMLLLSNVVIKLKGNPYKEAFFLGMKPVVIALISYAGYKIAMATFIIEGNNTINYKTLFIGIVSYIVLSKYKINPIYMIIVAGGMGLVIL